MPDVLNHALIPGNWTTLAFVISRVTGLMLVAPLWSMNGLPRSLRAALVAVLAVVLLPAADRVSGGAPLVLYPLGLAMEFLVGMAIGLTAAVLVHAMSLAGEVVALQMGLSLGPAVSPISDALVPGVGQMKTYLALLIYVTVGGHLVLVGGLAESFAALPPGMRFVFEDGAASAGRLLGTLFTAAVQAAAPAMVALILVDLAVAVTSRAVPQLNAMMVLFPATIGIGLIMFGASLPIIGSTVGGWMGELPARVSLAIEGFRAVPWGS